MALDPSRTWPSHAGATWLPGALIENAVPHPLEPWLAVACTHAADETGAVLVFDAESGRLRSTTALDEIAGWMETPGVLRWHPDGRRLATNAGTNGIALLHDARVVGHAFPDETRDAGVRYAWVGERIFSDTGALFEIRDGDWRFDFDDLGAPPFAELEWNAAIGAVVGRSGNGLAAFDPLAARVVYRDAATDLPPPRRVHWSGDGRRCARVHAAEGGDALTLFDGDDGRRLATLRPSLPRVDELRWGPDGALLVQCSASDAHTAPHLDLVRHGRLASVIDLAPHGLRRSSGIPEVGQVAWSPAGDGVAVLIDGREVQLRDAASGAVVSSFAAPAPPVPAGLPDFYRLAVGARQHKGGLLWISAWRLVRLAPHFVTVWSVDGTKLAEHLAPDPA